MKKQFVTFGEVMLRLKSPGHERLLQNGLLEATFGGGEANVAVSLANYGLPSVFVSVLPKNDIGDACIRELRGLNVDTRYILRQGERIGIYFLETGSNQRPSKVIYDREHSAIAEAEPGSIDWNSVFSDACWLHITGITPAISQSAAALSIQAVKTAKEMGLSVSCDLNYRKNLWKYGKAAHEVMPQIMPYVDTVIANEEDFQMSLGIRAGEHDVDKGEIDPDSYRAIAQIAMDRFPAVSRIAITLRQSLSADRNLWQACLYNGSDFLLSRRYELSDIVDRVGGGDSFSGGLIYGLNACQSDSEALEFAVAASCLKHTIHGDYNRVSVKEVEALMKGSGSGRVQR